MDSKQLMELLNIKPAKGVARVQAGTPAQVSTSGVRGGRSSGSSQSEISPYALQLDAYDKSTGGKLLRHNHNLRQTGLEPEAVSDLFSVNFLACPQTVEQCHDARRLEFVTKTLETPEYQALHRSTELNPVAAELATIELAKSFAALREVDKKQEEKRKEQRAKGKPINEKREGLKADIACLGAIGAGLKAAGKEVEKYEETMSALGCGPGVGRDDKIDVGRIVQIFQRAKDDPRLQMIMDLAGRYRRCAQAHERKKTFHGLDDVVGVVLDGDIGRLVPHELAMLATPETELDATRRLVERQSMCRLYQGVEKVGKGPIVLCTDESGSMDGEPNANAKALALSMAWKARHQRRWIGLVGFAGGTVGTRLALPPGKWDEGALLDWLAHFYSGGTTLDVPLRELPQVYWPEFVNKGMKRGKTNLILITDARVNLPRDLEQSFLRWKAAEYVKCISIVIGNDAGDLRRVSDNVFEVGRGRLCLESAAVQHCLAI